jgi:hypothetical protein
MGPGGRGSRPRRSGVTLEAAGEAALTPYRAILEHAELELELAGRGDLEGLSTLAGRWDDLTSAAPPDPPVQARPLLERASLIHDRTRIELIRLREALLAEVSTSSRARRAADGYSGQLPRRPRLDRSA